ncbi:hypothetical protein D6D02_06824 [Aureobasidium pullulans]|nr:hypothetical protein D6D02_06824 [Aureobasidium pullulans]
MAFWSLFVVQRGDVLFLRRTTQSTIQLCAVDDATSTVLLTDAAEVHGLKSLEETSPPKSEWPPNGHNISIVSIDTESCVVPKDMIPLRGYKYAQYMSELVIEHLDKKALVVKMSKVQVLLFLTLHAPTYLLLCQSRSAEPSSRDPSARRPLHPRGPEELILHGETHDPELTYQYYFRKAGYVMEFIEDPTTRTFVALRSWAPVKF